MPTILSGAVLSSGGSGDFLTLSGAQPALVPTPSSSTGFTIIVSTTTLIQYSNVLGNIVFDSGNLIQYTSGQDISIYTPGGGHFQVYTATYINDTSISVSPTTGALTVAGGVGVSGDLWAGGRINSLSTVNTTGTNSGALSVAGGVGINRDIYVGGNVTSLGNASFTGTMYASGVYDNATRVVSRILVGPGLSESTSTGPTVILTNTGVVSLTAGTGTRVSSTTGNVVVWVDPNIANQTLQQVTTNGNTTTNAVFFNNLTNTTATNSGSVVIAGGLGVAGNAYIGGTISASNINITNEADSTLVSNNGIFTNLQVTGTNYSSSTVANNSLYVSGGAGIQTGLTVGGNTWIYGNLYVIGTQTNVTNQTTVIGRTVVALSTTTSPAVLALGSGITVGPSASPYISLLYDGVSSWKSAGNLIPSVDNTYNLGSTAFRWANVYAVNGIFSGANSISTNTGALQVKGGAGIAGNLVMSGQLLVTNNTQATSTATGAVQITGGLGVGGNIYAGNIYSNGVLVGSGGSGGYSNVQIYAGSDISVANSATTGSFIISDISTLQSVTSRGNSTSQQIFLNGGFNSVNSATGSLVVAGGVGVSDSVNIGNNLTVVNSSTFFGGVNLSSNVFGLHYNTATWTFNDGKDIGQLYNYYVGSTATQAFLGRDNATGYLQWYSTGSMNNAGDFVGQLGTFKTGVLISNSATFNGTVQINSNTNITGTLNAGPIFSNGAPILTSASFGQFGVATIIAGTGTQVSTASGNVVIWNTSNLQSVTQTGNTTNQPIIITNTTNSVNSQSGALTVAGGIGVQGDVNVYGRMYSTDVAANTATILNLTVGAETVLTSIVVESPLYYPVEVIGLYNTTSSYYSGTVNTGTNAYAAYTLQNDATNYVEFGISGSNRTNGNYGQGSAYIYLNPGVPSFNIGNSSPINFFTEGMTTGNPAALSIGTTTTTVINNLLVKDNSYSPTPSTGINIQSNARTSYSSLTFSNTSLNGQSFTFDLGGSNRAGQGGAAVNEGNFTLHDDVANAYRLVVAKTTGHVIINTTTDNGVHTLQVNGSITATNIGITSTATIGGNLIVSNTATFNSTVIVGNSAMQSSVTVVNTTNPTSVDSFDVTKYRSAKSLVQIEDGNIFYLVEIALLCDNSGNVYISQYGIISTGSPLGDFTANIVNNQAILYFTGYDTTVKTINVVRTSIGV